MAFPGDDGGYKGPVYLKLLRELPDKLIIAGIPAHLYVIAQFLLMRFDPGLPLIAQRLQTALFTGIAQKAEGQRKQEHPEKQAADHAAKTAAAPVTAGIPPVIPGIIPPPVIPPAPAVIPRLPLPLAAAPPCLLFMFGHAERVFPHRLKLRAVSGRGAASLRRLSVSHLLPSSARPATG